MRNMARGVLCLIAGLTMTAAHATTKAATESAPASYKITLVSVSPLKVRVDAEIPIDGRMLDMDQTYPADLPKMAAGGWPALISNLAVHDPAGKEIKVTSAGNKGWQLPDSMRSLLKLSYDVDYSILAASGWSSFLESAFTDDDNAIIVGRSVFITSKAIGAATIEIVTPKGWIPIVPWAIDKKHHYSVKSREDLIDNMLAFSKREPDVVTAAGFRMQIVSMGHWLPLRPVVRPLLETIIRREVHLMHFDEREIYDVVLLPVSDEGGNAFRQSFAYCYADPGKTNIGVWGNTLAHEIFHYWNYARLKGASYSESQWFQEGFTEYVANLVMVQGKIINESAFVEKLGEHVQNYRKLTTSLENYGTHKGPPLYSAGALVAFMWDVKIREASGGKRNIGDFFRNLMTQTDSGARSYTWTDIKAALQSTADGDWEDFYQAYIKGHEPLPLDETLLRAGLRLEKSADGTERVSYDSAAPAKAKALWKSLVSGEE